VVRDQPIENAGDDLKNGKTHGLRRYVNGINHGTLPIENGGSAAAA
jgi:hypothetical protein